MSSWKIIHGYSARCFQKKVPSLSSPTIFWDLAELNIAEVLKNFSSKAPGLSFEKENSSSPLYGFGFESGHESLSSSPSPRSFLNKQLLDDSTERAGFRRGHVKHDNAYNVGPFWANSGFCLVEKYEDEPFPVRNFGDAFFPPGKKLFMRQGREEVRDGAVVSDT
ncbi:hypothetical protein FCULG_00001616 [Fusarium culmorum]|uniref:Uncharacterized protein n=1 Tax=Fusarium culmorum TaxID=5516 RepID=A0A2T4GQ58_FUSCU|nr:hypothetical protein FCULG_00001616 [Fusarium culmorum]